MTDLHLCPACGGRMKFSRIKQRGNFIDKRRDCDCGHADRILIRQEIATILEVAKKLPRRVRRRSPGPPQTKIKHHNKEKRGSNVDEN